MAGLRELKHDVALRDAGQCAIGLLRRDKHCMVEGWELHHIIPRSRPFKGLHTMENVVLACSYCHAKYGQSRRMRAELLRHLQSKFGYAYDLPEYKEYL